MICFVIPLPPQSSAETRVTSPVHVRGNGPAPETPAGCVRAASPPRALRVTGIRNSEPTILFLTAVRRTTQGSGPNMHSLTNRPSSQVSTVARTLARTDGGFTE
jgi:hypothetical protein